MQHGHVERILSTGFVQILGSKIPDFSKTIISFSRLKVISVRVKLNKIWPKRKNTYKARLLYLWKKLKTLYHFFPTLELYFQDFFQPWRSNGQIYRTFSRIQDSVRTLCQLSFNEHLYKTTSSQQRKPRGSPPTFLYSLYSETSIKRTPSGPSQVSAQ